MEQQQQQQQDQQQEQEKVQKLQLDVNKIINYLTQEIANGVKEQAILNATNEKFQALIDNQKEIIEKQKEVIQAYEDKEKVKKLG